MAYDGIQTGWSDWWVWKEEGFKQLNMGTEMGRFRKKENKKKAKNSKVENIRKCVCIFLKKSSCNIVD